MLFIKPQTAVLVTGCCAFYFLLVDSFEVDLVDLSLLLGAGSFLLSVLVLVVVVLTLFVDLEEVFEVVSLWLDSGLAVLLAGALEVDLLDTSAF